MGALDILQIQTPRFTIEAGLDTGPVSAEPYRSPEFFAQERERVFRRAWLCLGRVEQLPVPGSFFVREIEVCEASVLVTRLKNGSVKAFHNLCSHRHNQVVLEERGVASRFTCRYHSWTYGNDGALLGVPDKRNFFNLDQAKCGLTSIAADVWDGWIFINLAPEPEVSLTEFLGDIAEIYSDLPLTTCDHSFAFEAQLDANWKVVADAFAETYHIPAIHPETIGATFMSDENPFARPISIRTHGPHRAASMWGNNKAELPAHRHVERLLNRNIETTSVLVSANQAQAQAYFHHPALNPTNSDNWAGDMLWLFPNFHLNTSAGGFWTHEYWPIAHNRTRWVSRFFVGKSADAWQRLQLEHYVARMAEVVLEDLGNCERTQRGLASRGKDFMLLQDGEAAIRHSIRHVRKWVDSAAVRQALL